MTKQINIESDMDCDAEYFLCSWFNINSLPKHKMILDAKDICDLMEEYHKQKSNSKLEEVLIGFIEWQLPSVNQKQKNIRYKAVNLYLKHRSNH